MKTMRYQIADGILDYVHICWLTFLLAPVGTFAMGSATRGTPSTSGPFIFGPLLDDFPPYTAAIIVFVLATTPILAIGRGWWHVYAVSRCGTALFYGFLAFLCLRARPVSTGAIYSVLSIAALLLVWGAVRAYRERRVRA